MSVKYSENKKAVFLITTLATAISVISACSVNSLSDNKKDGASNVSTRALPQGLGFEQKVAVPEVSDPLPSLKYLSRNNGQGRFYLNSNPIDYTLRGINDIWKGTNDHWQETAGDYTDEANGYKAGDGPNPHNAANGKPSDYVEAGTEIVDSATWEANIKYVVDVTSQRTDKQALYAFLDDVRSKQYSTIDGFGPLTEDYAENSGAYAGFGTIYVSDVTGVNGNSNDAEENIYFRPADNDNFVVFGGQESSVLGDIVKLASTFRSSSASTSGPKYLFATPRPWRMTNTGALNFQKVETLTCVDGQNYALDAMDTGDDFPSKSATDTYNAVAKENRATREYRIDKYTTSVNMIPGLFCGRRAHSSSKESELLYTATTENRRKDNGYPSGHTNAGVLGSLAYAYAMPERFAAHVARGLDLGENRIVAGMHSPVDVIGGRIQATMVAAFALNTHPEIAQAAYDKSQEYFGAQAAAAGMSLYDYANRTVAEEGSFINKDGETVNVSVFNNNRFSDHDAIKDTYTFRLTYGLPQTGDKTLDPIVPEGAELLLKTRQPYLSDAQRRAVLATTEVESGYPLLDKTNGWGRLNLLAASDGYGAFNGDVYVTMDASKGGFNALDWWRNDISGDGKLTKDGTGELVLMGENLYHGGTVVKGGTLKAASSKAFGSGDLYLDGGKVEVTTDGALEIGGNANLISGELAITLDSDRTQMSVSGEAYIAEGVLTLNAGAATIKDGDTVKLIDAEKGLTGQFSSVTMKGYTVELDYSDNAIFAKLHQVN